jgi:hypothetical protein
MSNKQTEFEMSSTVTDTDEKRPLLSNDIKLQRERARAPPPPGSVDEAVAKFKLSGDDPYGGSVVYSNSGGSGDFQSEPPKRPWIERMQESLQTNMRKAPYYVPIMTWLPLVRFFFLFFCLSVGQAKRVRSGVCLVCACGEF